MAISHHLSQEFDGIYSYYIAATSIRGDWNQGEAGEGLPTSSLAMLASHDEEPPLAGNGAAKRLLNPLLHLSFCAHICAFPFCWCGIFNWASRRHHTFEFSGFPYLAVRQGLSHPFNNAFKTPGWVLSLDTDTDAYTHTRTLMCCLCFRADSGPGVPGRTGFLAR